MIKLVLTLIAGFALMAVACNPEDPKVEVMGVSLSKTSVDMVEGDTQSLSATIEPADATDKTLTWSSGDNDVATVEQSGKVTAVSPGTATISVKSTNGKSATCRVTVNAKFITVTDIFISDTELNLVEGDSGSLTASVSPSNATDKSISWQSVPEAVATVDQSGNVTAVAPGYATITATSHNGFQAECKLTVTAKEVPVESISLSPVETVYFNIGDSFKINVTIAPANATDRSISWTVDNTDVATVDDEGRVTGVSEGVATVTATAHNGKTATKTVNVLTPVVQVESVTITPTETVTVNVGETQTLQAVISPENATNKSITWSSDNTSVATVSSEGVVTGKYPGSTIITARSDNGKSATKYVFVSTVNVTGITLDNSKYLFDTIGSTATITATILPENATNKNVTWTVDNTSVIRILSQSNGGCVIESLHEGYAILTAKTQNGSKTATAYIAVGEGDNLTSLSPAGMYIACCSIQAGTFDMGATSDDSSANISEKPQHQVTLSEFSISKFEITCYQFAEFLNDKGVGIDGMYDGHKLVENSNSGVTYYSAASKWVPTSGKEHYPVVRVSWHGANEFAIWAGGRLPTEAEWEYACRAGTTTPYHWGATSSGAGDYAWYYANSNHSVHPVGKKQPNAWRLYDMSGNAAEWCNDWFGYYTADSQHNPVSPGSGSVRIIRGGSNNDVEALLRSSGRAASNPDTCDNRYGFRVAISN